MPMQPTLSRRETKQPLRYFLPSTYPNLLTRSTYQEDRRTQSSTSLSFVTHNSRSIPSNIDEFYVDFEGLNKDVLGFRETRLSDFFDSIYQIAGYDMKSISRNTNGRATVLYIIEEFHDTYKHSGLSHFESSDEKTQATVFDPSTMKTDFIKLLDIFPLVLFHLCYRKTSVE